MSNVLEVSGLNKSYEKFALSDLSFSLQEDCITGFIGINGAGKTTTIRTILGLAMRNSGTIKFSVLRIGWLDEQNVLFLDGAIS